MIIGILIFAIIVSGGQLVTAQVSPSNGQPVSGGVHVEGVLGSPRYINPLLAGTNSADQDIVKLVYSGLVKIGAGREIIPDLAESWDIADGGRTYVFHLREGVKWHDGAPFTSSDVAYTFHTIQSNEYTGVLKTNFLGITVEEGDERTIKFTLAAPSSSFLFDMSVGIIPQHIFAEIPASEFTTVYNTADIIGTGPYQYDAASTATTVTLRRFHGYYGNAPYLDTVAFYFYDNRDSLLTAFQNRTVSAAGFTDPETDKVELKNTDVKYSYNLPQYRAVFFNQLSDNEAIKDKIVRQALALAVNKPEIIDQVEGGLATVVDSPILPGFWGHNPEIKKYTFNLMQAAELLKREGWRDIDGDGYVEKNNVRLSFKLSIRDDEKSVKASELLKKNWETIGAEVIVEPAEVTTLIKDVIRPRNYQVLLFGQDLGGDSDPYVYWHSSQIKDPGLALAVEVDKDIDNNLEQARISPDVNRAIGYYLNFQNAFADLVPAILLYQPKYIYLVDGKVKGIDENINLSSFSDRFANIDKWYVKTKREAVSPSP
jgi:peptide/nickel transport system substrate-binding protein